MKLSPTTIALVAPPLVLLGGLNAAAAEPAVPPRNFLFIITDQQHAGALGCAGNPDVKTPNMDKLAARGIRFGKSYCTYPLCCPSRGSLFTSRTPHELRIFTNADAELAGKALRSETLGELFQAAGYETAYAGKWHLQAPFPSFKGRQIPGFSLLPLAGRDPGTVDQAKAGKGLTVDPNTADAAIKFLRQPHSKPFLLVASLLNPHDICEYPGCAALRKLLPADPAQLPPPRPNMRDPGKLPSALQKYVAQKGAWTEQQWREYLYIYYRLVEIADGEAGRVLTALEQTGLASNTIVVFTSDHGEMMGSHRMVTKQKLYEEAAAVPLIVAPPDAKAGVDKTHLVSGLDIMPTLLDYAGIAAPASLEGKSLRPLVEGKDVPWRDFVVSEVNVSAEARMVRTARFKYVVFAAGDDREQFFDMEQDPGEMTNRVADPALAAEVARHRVLLDRWRKETRDSIGQQPAVDKATNKKNRAAAGAQPQPS
jgi:choline-sulfatase